MSSMKKKKHNCRQQSIIERHFHSHFFSSAILLEEQLKMPKSAILIKDLPRYIWHFSAAQPHLPLCLFASPATQTLTLQRSVRNQTLSQLPFSSSPLPLEWTILFSTTAQWPSFHFPTLQNRKCMPDFSWNQQQYFTASVFKQFYAIIF